MADVVVIIGTGGIGRAIARRQGAGRHLLLADIDESGLTAAAAEFAATGYVVTTRVVDVSNRASVEALAAAAASLGNITQVVNTAGLSPNMASVARILSVDLYGTAAVFEAFGAVIAPGGSAIVISSMAGHMLPALPPEHNLALANTPAEELLALDFLQPGRVPDGAAAYGLAKRANGLRVQAEAMRWAARGARVNAISPGIILTPLAVHELNSPIGAAYRALIEGSATKRVGTPDEVAVAAAYLLGPDAGFITGTDLLIDGGVIAALKTGHLALGAARS